MPSKKKKGSSRPPNSLPVPGSTDSVRRDIEAARDAQLSSAETANEDGLDLVDDLLATLDARDAAAAGISDSEAPTSSSSLNRTRSGSDKLKNKGHEIKESVQGLLTGMNGMSMGNHNQNGSSSQPIPHSNSQASNPSSPNHSIKSKLFGISSHSNSNSPSNSLLPPSNSNSTSSSDLEEPSSTPKENHHHHSSFGSLFKNHHHSNDEESSDGKKKLGRQALRKQRKQAEIDEIKRQAEEELKANGGQPDLAEIERKGIEDMCKTLGVEMKEINPDGHCLYAAVADQLNHKGKTTKKIDYRDTRKTAAEHMRSNRDEFQPFISDSDEFMAGIENKEAGLEGGEKEMAKHYLDYCDAIENTGVWGGHTEILALSRAYKTQIHVVQSGSPVLKVGEGEQKGNPLMISYHRRMYGLGEHYNSLRKKK